MNLRLVRNAYRKDGIFGEILNESGNTIFVCLERSYPSVDESDSSIEVYLPKVPKGKYRCVRGEHKLSDLVPFETFEITGVDGCFGILFHAGNYNEDSSGCILVGKGMGFKLGGKDRMITNSVKAFKEFMAIQKECDEFWITIE